MKIGSFFSRSQASSVMGIDISSSSVKLVELDRDRSGNFTLERCGIEPLERGWISDGNIEKFEEVVGAVQRVIARSGTKTKQVVMALPTSTVISKKVTLPAGLSERELEVQVESEASQQLPFSLDEVSLDFCVVGNSAVSADDVDVVLAAARKEKVDDMQGLAEACGLSLVILDVENYAARLGLSRVVSRLPNEGRGAIVALLELGSMTSNLQVVKDDEILYERDQVFGGMQLTQMIARQYGFTPEEAETKKRSGDLPSDYGSVVLQPFVESLAQEIERALKFFFTSTPHNRVDCILLAGGTAGLYGLAETVAEHTSFPCHVVNPFEGMDVGRAVDEKQMKRSAPSYLTACGLAMRRFLR